MTKKRLRFFKVVGILYYLDNEFKKVPEGTILREILSRRNRFLNREYIVANFQGIRINVDMHKLEEVLP